MRRLTCTIRIGRFEFNQVTEVRIRSSWKNLTDTCSIVLPRNLKWKNRYLKDEIQKGDGVEVLLGYDYNEVLEFSGFVSRLSNNIPVEIECEDEMWQLKQTNVSKSWRSVTLPEMLQDILPQGTQTNVLNADLGAFRIDNQVSVAKVLQELRRSYGFCSFYRDGVLVVGYPYSQVETLSYELQYENDLVSDRRLTWHEQDEVAIKVRAISMKPAGGKDIIELGEEGGEVHTLHFYNLSTAELRKSAQEEMKRINYPGYRGFFQTFGVPQIRHSDQVQLNSVLYPERNGTYLVDSVNTSFGEQGYRRDIELGPTA